MGHDDLAAAVKLVAEAPGKDLQHQDTDEWWRVRRVLARRLIDLGHAQTAYRVASEAALSGQSLLIAPNFTSWPAGSRCAFSPIRPRRSGISLASIDGSTDPIVAGACRLLARPRPPRWPVKVEEMQRAIRDRRPLPNRLLRAARARPARPWRDCVAFPTAGSGGKVLRASCCARRTFFIRSARSTLSCRS